MKKYIKFIGLIFLMAAFVACDQASQDVSPTISPNDKPMVSFAISGDATEGDEVVLTITFDKPIDRAVTFTPVITGGTADDHDFTMEAVVMQPYSTVAELKIATIQDSEAEQTENVEFDIEIQGIAERYLVHPDVVLPSYDVSINNYFDPNKLIIVFGWDTADDIDIVTYSNTTGSLVPWGDSGAGSGNPETDNNILLDNPVGEYFVNVMDWGSDSFNYTFTISQPNGTIQTIDGTFDRTNYVNDPWTAWGGSYDSYRVLSVVNDGTSFVITEL